MQKLFGDKKIWMSLNMVESMNMNDIANVFGNPGVGWGVPGTALAEELAGDI